MIKLPQETTRNNKKQQIAIIGFGPYCKSLYYKWLCQNSDSEFELLIDLESQKNEIELYFSDKVIKPRKIVLLPNSERLSSEISQESKSIILNNIKNIDKVIISTEPKSHFKYQKLLVENNKKILVDKPPLIGFDEKTKQIKYQKIMEEYEIISQLLSEYPNSSITINCQRRAHKGFQLVNNILKETIDKFKIPITYIDCSHGGGDWYMPNEMIERENHPYKYGYGKIMHSGYHFLDMLTFFLKNNNFEKDTKLDIYSRFLTCEDHVGIFNNEFYKKHLQTDYSGIITTESFKELGEVDSYNLLTFYDKNNKTRTIANLNLMSNTFSQRSWTNLPKDTYKGNGRVRHERWNIQVGHLLNIHIHSYRSYEKSKIEKVQVIEGEVGSDNHFDVLIFRNSEIIGGESFEKIEIGGIIPEIMDYSRYECLENFVYDRATNSSFLDHKQSNLLSSLIYQNLDSQKNNKIPLISTIYV